MDSRTDEAPKEIYERLRPGNQTSKAHAPVAARFFDPSLAILAPVGRLQDR